MNRVHARAAAGAAVLLAAALVVYLPSLGGGFLWDDDQLLLRSPAVRSAAGLARAWLDPRANLDYYPLTHTSWAIEYRLAGLDPFVLRLDNVLLHAGNSLLLWSILRLLGVPWAWAAAALFLVHPMHVQSVAWISERKNVLSGLFCLLSVRSFLLFSLARDPGRPWRRRRRYALSLLFFVCAMFAKPVTMAAAGVLPLLLWYRRGRLTRGDALATAPFFLAAAPMAALTIWVQYHHVQAGRPEFHLALAERAMLAGRVLWFYAAKLLVPRGLSFAHAKWTLDPAHWWWFAPSAAALALLAATALLHRRIGRGAFAAAASFATLLAPALGFVNIYWHRFYYVADHVPYLASAALVAPLAAAASGAAARRPPWGRRAAATAVASAAALLALLAWQRAAVFADAATLWRDAIAKSPASWIAHNNLGNVLAARGEVDEAARHYREALRLFPGYDKPHRNLGLILLGQGKTEEAIAEFREALRANPGFSEARLSLAEALAAMGRVEEANRETRRALGLE